MGSVGLHDVDTEIAENQVPDFEKWTPGRSKRFSCEADESIVRLSLEKADTGVLFDAPTCKSAATSNHSCLPQRRAPAAGPDTSPLKARSNTSREAVVRRRNPS